MRCEWIWPEVVERISVVCLGWLGRSGVGEVAPGVVLNTVSYDLTKIPKSTTYIIEVVEMLDATLTWLE